MEQLIFLGTGGGFTTKYGTNSAYLIKNGKMILFDCGETTRIAIQRKQIFQKFNVESMDIILTHFHTDHMGSIGNQILYNNIHLSKPTTIIFPNKDKVESLMALMEMPKEIWNTDKTKEKKMYDIKSPEEIVSYQLVAYKQQHGLTDLDFNLMPMEAYGYLYGDEQKFFYSGDSETIPDEILEMFLLEQINHMYYDASMENWAGHMNIDKFAGMIPHKKRGQVTLMHMSDDFDLGYAKKLGFKTARKK